MLKSKRTKQLESKIESLENRLTQKEKCYVSLSEKHDNLRQEVNEASAEKEQKEIEKYFKAGETVKYLGQSYVIVEIVKETANGRLFMQLRQPGKAIMRTQFRNKLGNLVNHIFYLASLPALIVENKKDEKEKVAN